MRIRSSRVVARMLKINYYFLKAIEFSGDGRAFKSFFFK